LLVDSIDTIKYDLLVSLNQQVVTGAGSQFVQEDAPDAASQATARFVAKALAGQIA
jgi:hypothetical protein